jgi:PAS domain S-box-containing protein
MSSDVSVRSSSSDALIIVDEQDRVIDATRLACDLTGYTREDLLSRSLQDLCPRPRPWRRAGFSEGCRKRPASRSKPP